MKKKHPSIDLSKEKPFNRVLTYPKDRSSGSGSGGGGSGGGGGGVSASDFSKIDINELMEAAANNGEALASSSNTEKVNAIYKRSEIIFRKHFDKFLNRPVSVTKSKLYDEQLAKMIVKQYCPFTIVESEEFKVFISLVYVVDYAQFSFLSFNFLKFVNLVDFLEFVIVASFAKMCSNSESLSNLKVENFELY